MTSTLIDRVDGLSSAAAIKGPCRLATTANISLSGLQTIDGVAVARGDRVLVKDQTAGSENGILIADTGPWRRSKDFNKTKDVVTGTVVLVNDGASASGFYQVTAANPINIGTDAIAFARLTPGATTAVFGVDTRATIKALNTAFVETVFLREARREGIFKWTAGNFSAQITADTQEGIYIKADAIASTAGAWVRQFNGRVFPEWFGATGDGTTSDQTAVAAAVAAALASGDDLEWTNTYLTTASITSFHAVRHFGPGVVKRGSDLFYVAPKEGQTNTLYVAASGGSTTNDGITPSQPYSTLQGAFDALALYWPLNGKWVISLAAGTYSAASQRTARLGPANETETTPDTDSYTANGMSMKNMLTIQGADVGYDPATNPTPVPTTIFDAASAAVVGMQLERGLKILVKDVKFQNYDGSSSSAGIAADGQCWLRTENVHADNCVLGIRALNHSQLEVKGGTINACDTGIQTLFNTKQEIGNQAAGAVGQGPFITNCGEGLQVQEGSTGHSDFVSYADNLIAVDIQINSRVNLNGSDFKRNTVAVRAGDGNFFPANVNWNMGTADANTETIRLLDASSIASENTTAWRELSANLAPTTSSAATETTVASFTLDTYKLSSLPTSIYPGKAIRIRAAGTITGVAGTKTFRAKLGGTLLAAGVMEADANGGYSFEAEIRLLTSATQATLLEAKAGLGTNRTKVGLGTSSINTIVAGTLALTFTVQCANAADSVATNFVTVELKG